MSSPEVSTQKYTSISRFQNGINATLLRNGFKNCENLITVSSYEDCTSYSLEDCPSSFEVGGGRDWISLIMKKSYTKSTSMVIIAAITTYKT